MTHEYDPMLGGPHIRTGILSLLQSNEWATYIILSFFNTKTENNFHQIPYVCANEMDTYVCMRIIYTYIVYIYTHVYDTNTYVYMCIYM